jgi:hypothetical protein
MRDDGAGGQVRSWKMGEGFPKWEWKVEVEGERT